MIFTVSHEPRYVDEIQQFCAVINVSDSPGLLFESPVPYFWYPINEISKWSYGPFYFAAKIVDNFKSHAAPILFHCHAGINRSVTVATALWAADCTMGSGLHTRHN